MTAKGARPVRSAWPDPCHWHALPAGEVLRRLEAPATGLGQAEAAARLARRGPNVLPTKPPPGILEVGLRQLRSPLIYVLLAAAVASIVLGDLGDAAFIGGPVALAWQHFDEPTRRRARTRYLDAIAGWRHGDGYRVPAEFVVVAAMAPSVHSAPAPKPSLS